MVLGSLRSRERILSQCSDAKRGMMTGISEVSPLFCEKMGDRRLFFLRLFLWRDSLVKIELR